MVQNRAVRKTGGAFVNCNMHVVITAEVFTFVKQIALKAVYTKNLIEILSCESGTEDIS